LTSINYVKGYVCWSTGVCTARHRRTSPTTSSWLPLSVPAVNSGLLTLRLWWSGLPDVRRSATAHFPWQLHAPGTAFRQLLETRRYYTYLPEPLEDMAVWTDTGVTLTSFSGCTSFRFFYFNNSVKCPCNVIHDSVTLIFIFLIIIIIKLWSYCCNGSFAVMAVLLTFWLYRC